MPVQPARARIDVLLPVCSARRTLPSALGDVLAQRDVAVRVLAVVDGEPDGRDDGSAAWLERRARHEPRLLVLRGPGAGAGAALDVGLAAVETPLVAHMEADDRCPPDRLARLHAALTARAAGRDGARPLAAITSRAGQFGARTPGMRRYLDWQNALLDHAAMAAERFVEIPAMHQTGLYRTEAVRAIGGYAPRGRWPADIDFWLRWFEHDEQLAPLRVSKLPAVLYRWRQHDRQATRSRLAADSVHSLAALRQAKLHYLARRHGRDGWRPRPVLLVSTGQTLLTWRAALVAAGLELTGCADWKPGQPPPRLPPGALVLAAYGMAAARARLAHAWAGALADGELLFTA